MSSTPITPKLYQRHLELQQQIIDQARQLAPTFAELTAGDREHRGNDLRATEDRYCPDIELTAEHIEFSARPYYDGDTEYFTLPAGYLIDPDSWTATYRADRARREQQAAQDAERRKQEQAAQNEAADRAQLAELISRYGIPQEARS